MIMMTTTTKAMMIIMTTRTTEKVAATWRTSIHRKTWMDKKPWMDNVREDLKEKNIDLTRIGETTRNREVCRTIIKASSSAR